MSALFNVPGWELDVDNPGYGELTIAALTDPHDREPLVTQEWRRELNGPNLGAFLAAVTAQALGGTPGAFGFDNLPRFLTAAVARELLPALQAAALLALAGTDRYERVYPDGERPAEPLCARCHTGSDYTTVASMSSWCAEHGHRPFGTRLTWDEAQSMYRWDLERWERAQARAREQALEREQAARHSLPAGDAIDQDAARRQRRGH